MSRVGPIIGPVFGGLLADNFGWQSMFYFLAAFALVVVLAVLVFLPEVRIPSVHRLFLILTRLPDRLCTQWLETARYQLAVSTDRCSRSAGRPVSPSPASPKARCQSESPGETSSLSIPLGCSRRRTFSSRSHSAPSSVSACRLLLEFI